MKHLFFKIRQSLCAIVTLTLIAVFYLRYGCPIRFFTGISCPGCGMSRAISALLKLDFTLAFEMHPLVFLLPVAVLVYFLRRLIPKRTMTVLCISALLLLLTVYIIRMTQQGNVVYADFESGMLFRLFNKLKQLNIF